MGRPILNRLGRFLMALLCTAGVLSGGFLLLCAGGVLDPAVLVPREEAAAVSAQPAQPVPAENPEPFRTLRLSPEELDQASVLAQGYDGVVVTMKEADGSLGYVSALALAADAGASWGDLDRNEALRALNRQPELYTVAQVSCLRDSLVVQQDPSLALRRESGSPWRDAGGLTWLDPANTQVQDYLIGLCRELAQLGFDEVVLTDCCYPTQGDLTCLAGTGDRAGTLETFCRRLQGALADYPVRLSVVGEGDSLAPNSPSGQTAALLASFPGRVWAEEENAAALAVFSPVVMPE